MRTVDAAGLGIGETFPPRIMGVLNVSQESPYDPSVYADSSEAAAYVDDMIETGADIIDIGLESANKRLDVLSAEEERMRLQTAIETIESVSGEAVFSIETRYGSVADRALSEGFDMVNDICGFADPDMPDICEQYDAAVVKMASPPDLERPGAVEEISWHERMGEEWARHGTYVDKVYEALKQGEFTDKTIVDPAFGGWSQAKTLEDDRDTFRRLGEFRELGQPILVSINRKNFLRDIAGRSTEEALPVSLAATALAVERGADVIRTHDVAETRDAALIGAEFSPNRVRDREGGVEEHNIQPDAEGLRHMERVGDQNISDDATVRTYEITGLDADERDRMAQVALEHDVKFVHNDQRGLLMGTPAELHAMAGALDDGERGVSEILALITTEGYE